VGQGSVNLGIVVGRVGWVCGGVAVTVAVSRGWEIGCPHCAGMARVPSATAKDFASIEPVHVRPARAEDAAQIAVVHVRSWQGAYRGLVPQEYLDSLDPAQRVSTWKRALEQPDSPRSRTMVIDSDDAVVGFVNFGPTRDEDENPEQVGEIRAIYLLPDTWGKGFDENLWVPRLSVLPERVLSRRLYGFLIPTSVPAGSTK
jgi:Acetyltransferase (GNAT) family